MNQKGAFEREKYLYCD